MQPAPIDLRPFREGDDADRRRIARQFDEAGRRSGFFAVTGHGVDPDLIDEMLAVTSAFFDLPVEDKMACYLPDRALNRGYAPEGSEALAYSLGERDLPNDLFEAYNIGRDLTAAHLADPYFADQRDRYFAENVWPSVPAGMRDTWLAYWDAAERVGDDIMDAAALALDLPEGSFRPFLDRSPSVMRANNYQRRADAQDVEPGQMRMGAHTDYGSITVLLAERVPGLQIRDDSGVWNDVIPPEDGFLVNVGDLLAEWTNDRWRSTLHRVVPPSAIADGAVHRRSIAWFQQPNWDALISCLPTCCDAANPPRYGEVTSGDHLLAKLMGPRMLRPSERSAAYVTSGGHDTPTDRAGRTMSPTSETTSDSGDDAGVVIDIAGAVRARRLAAGLTMRELAAGAGMSQPFLSNLENSRAMPSIATLYKIANALGVSPREFLPEERARVQLVRHGEGALGPVGDEPGSAVTRVVSGAPGRLVEAHTYLAEPGASMGDWFEHDGEDLLFVVSGAVRVELGDGQSFELGTGDVIWYEGTLPHRWSQVGDATTELLCVHARSATPDSGHAPGSEPRR